VALRGVIVCGGLAHVGAAAAWCWLAPGGFPVGHPRFVVGVVLPTALIACGVLGIVGAARRWDRVAHAALASWTATWCVGAATSLTLYDDGRFRIAVGCFVPCAVLLGLCVGTSFVGQSRWSWGAGLLALGGAAIGATLPFAVRAPVSSTTPLGGTPSTESWPAVAADRHEVQSGVWLDSRTGTVSVDRDGIAVHVHPLLRFWSRSPDRGWTLFARAAVRGADEPLTLTRALGTEGRVRFFGRGVAEHVMDVSADSPGAARIEAWSDLEQPEYAHQSSCASVTIQGLAAPTIELSVAPGKRFEVLPHDYPSGRPLRFASLMPGGRIRILEASSGEKGPFTTLAEGSVERDEPLVMTLYTADRPSVRIVLHDFASQASTELSPTAGWGVPQNDISFTRREPSGDVSIQSTWAGTGIGRGFDTVGHALGTYRNRMDVEILR
jgi:hypothetical protein